MAKKQLKKLNQPKKYLQGGSNMNSVSMMRQNPYYLGQVEKDAADEKLNETRQQAMDVRQNAIQAKAESEAQEQAALNQSMQQGVGALGKGVVADKKAGNLGKLMLNNPNLTTATSWAPIAASTAPTAASIGQVAPTVVNPIMTNAGGNAATQMVVGQAAPTMSTVGQTVTGTANVAGTANAVTGATAGATGSGGLMAANMSSLGAAGIGVAATIGGQVIKKKSNDNSAYTFTDKERRGNVGGSMLSSAGTGFSTGATLGSIVPGVGNVVGGLIGAGIGATIGAIKSRKENKAAEEEAKRLGREQDAIAGANQSARINSMLTGADTGYGYNSSTNMNNQFTNAYQVAKTGGVKKVPGGKIVPIEGTDAVEFKGKSHENGGVTIDKNTEVEGGETMDQVAMSNNNKQDYIFSKYLKLGGKSFAQRHKEILKGSGSQAEIQQLASMQEKVAGRNSKQVAAYGGFHKYLDGGVKPCPECPPGTICDVATGACVPDEDSGSNSYDWNATGLDGFKAKQQSAAPAAPAKQEPEKPAGPTLYFNTNTKKYTYRDESGKELMSGYDQNRLTNQMNAQRPGATGFDQQLADAEKRETPGVKPPVDNQTVVSAQNGTSNAPADATASTAPANTAKTPAPTATVNPGVQPPANNTAPTITDMASLDAAYDANKISLGEYNAKRKEFEAAAPKPAANTQPVATTTNPPANTTTTATTKEKGWGAAGAPSSQIDRDQDPTVDPTGKKLPDGYVWDPTLNAPVSATAADNAASASANKTGTATYNPAPGVAPQAGATVTTTNPPAAANTGASTDPTVTYVNSNDPNAPAPAPQTPEEIEAARLAGLPRMFMGASRKVDEATGNVTIDKGKPLMGVGAMAGSRLGTATGSQEDLAKVTNNSYDQAWTNKADNLYTNQKDASGGGLSSSDAIADRDKIAESNWGQKYGYKKGMTADEAKAAHGKFAEDVHSLFANNPDEMLGYFQYIIDGGDAKNKGSYLGKDAEQIRSNLAKQGYIDANGKPIAGKVVNGKTMSQYLEGQATNNAVGPIHNALGSYTAERGGDKIKLDEKKKKDEVITQELPKKYEPCPPGTYRSGDGTCKEVGDIPQKRGISGTMLAGLGQLVPVGAALLNPYKIAPGIVGAPAIKGAIMPRVNLNQERAANIQQNVAYKNAVLNQNTGPAGLVAMQLANKNAAEQGLKIDEQEKRQNADLAGREGENQMKASMFNADTAQKGQMFNAEFNQAERRYRREDILGALDTGAARIAGIVKDDRAYKSDERLARALDETGSYDRFTILEQLNKESKRKNSPYYGTTEAERRRMAAAMHKELNPEGYIAKSEYTKLQEEKDKLEKERKNSEKDGIAKFGGARQYVSRLGQLSGVRATKAKL